MKKLITILAVALATNLSAQSTITPTLKYSHFGGINFKADHELEQFDLGIKNVTDELYWLFDEGHASVKAIYDRSSIFSKQYGNNGNAQWSVLVGVTLVKGIDKWVGVEYGYFLGGTMEKKIQVVELLHLGLTMRNCLLNPSLNYQRINGANYLGVGLRLEY
jgi:hypothetical protein